MSVSTPWGESDTATAYGPGIVFYTTPSHGGFYLDAEHRGKIPAPARAFARRWAHDRGGWFEEDCAALAVITTFPDRFPNVTPAELETYAAMLADYVTKFEEESA